MSKNLQYWENAWAKGGADVGTYYKNADYVLKRYARNPFNSYGNDVHRFYFGVGHGLKAVVGPYFNSKSSRTTADRQSMQSVIDDLKIILRERPIYKDGDLFKILTVFEKKTGENYLGSFTVKDKHPYIKAMTSFFKRPCCKKEADEENDPLVRTNPPSTDKKC